jgi:hypothetical protein
VRDLRQPQSQGQVTSRLAARPTGGHANPSGGRKPLVGQSRVRARHSRS